MSIRSFSTYARVIRRIDWLGSSHGPKLFMTQISEPLNGKELYCTDSASPEHRHRKWIQFASVGGWTARATMRYISRTMRVGTQGGVQSSRDMSSGSARVKSSILIVSADGASGNLVQRRAPSIAIARQHRQT